MLEKIANLFYDPAVFWGIPLLLAVAWEIHAAIATRVWGGRGGRRD